MKIIVESCKKLFAKKVSYVASFGQFREEGTTKEQAKENLVNALEWLMNNANHEQTIVKQIPEANRTLILERSFDGYTILSIEQNNDKNVGSSHYGRINHREALQRLEQHVENYQLIEV